MEIEFFLELLKEGESEKVEFKESVSRDIHKEICAFANAEGGYILIGVSNDGKIVGCKTKEAKELITSYMISISPPPGIRFHEIKIENKRVLVVETEPSKTVCTIGNVAYIRVGTSKRPLSIQELIQRGVEKLFITFDRTITDIPISEIYGKNVNFFLKEREKRGLFTKNWKELFEKIGIIKKTNGKSNLSFAGALLFLKEPQTYFPFSYIRIKVGEEWLRIGGSLFELVNSSAQIVLENLRKKPIFVGMKREDKPIFPERALREAIVNAVVHRNYAIESEVFIYISENALRIINPGGFPPGVSADEPKPIPRNPLLYEIMFQTGYVEKEGGGIEMIKEECKNEDIDVDFISGENFMEVKFSKPIRFSPIEAKILELLSLKPLRSSEIAGKLKISKVTILKYISKLLERKLIKKEGKGKGIKYIKPLR